MDEHIMYHSAMDHAPVGTIGGKAFHLWKLKSASVQVPRWMVIDWESACSCLGIQPNEILNEQEWNQKIKSSHFPHAWMQSILRFFGPSAKEIKFAVRSSAADEDGTHHSFAGMFTTCLNITLSDIPDAVKKVWQSVYAQRVTEYRKNKKLQRGQAIGVIIQEMLNPRAAGVAFGADPVRGDVNVKIISAVWGLGEGLVSGQLDADVYRVRGKNTEVKPALKTHALVNDEKGGLKKIQVEENRQKIPVLTDSNIKDIIEILRELQTLFGHPQDIEFAVQDSTVYVLQSRPVTTTLVSYTGEYTLWDNSNIVESYPGITTPLTYTFILAMYDTAYRQFVSIMGVSRKTIKRNADIFAHTLGLVRGRVYYNLLNWYKMLAMLPGYSLNARFMENMMGVKERFDLSEDFSMNRWKAGFRTLLMVMRMVWLQWTLPGSRKQFKKHLDKVMERYDHLVLDELSMEEITTAYIHFEQSLLRQWKAPLVNDFFAMISFGMLQKLTVKYNLNGLNPNIHNDLLCGSHDIISTQPVHRSLYISNLIICNAVVAEAFKTQSEPEIWHRIGRHEWPEIEAEINRYLHDFGNRCVGELKLETVSYAQRPELFIGIIKSYVQQGIQLHPEMNQTENTIRKKAEEQMNRVLRGKWFKRWKYLRILRKTRERVSARENLRYERTRGFGMVRKLFFALGKKAVAAGFLHDPHDIFYLELQEIINAGQHGGMQTWKEKTETRKKEFGQYELQPQPSERFFTYGNDFSDDFIYSTEKLSDLPGDLSGIGCCPGNITGRVRIVTHPSETKNLEGDILVASSTDPGWVTLFMTTAGILVERGSLLSHSAIVSREMGIPCIVSINGLLRSLTTGDIIEMDGRTGRIKILQKHESTTR